MEKNNITFKATVNGLILIMREEDSFEEILEQTGRKLESAGRFFKGASITINYRGKKLTKDQELKLSELISERTDAEIRSFQEDKNETESVQPLPTELPQKTKIKKMFFKGINEGKTKFHRGTVRSGQLISSDGNIVIIGDVNPGGELEAAGNVVVMGTLRGVVHAGADGNKDAIVVALNLQPSLLSIGEVITRAPDEEEARTSYVPEIAFVKEDIVYIESFLPQYK